MALAWNLENGRVLCKSLAGIIVGGDGQIGGGAVIVVIWGFLEVFTMGCRAGEVGMGVCA